ncbi:hypothetical protein GUJ93_ZPchr0003g17796 [Zizania palustris]|uniref:CASP-like protein n=1 Tax=Zizania palustris TaxID=103762 RepID=A0A8J5VYI7_ZIZPA|nr:hypothetical protein GUJ93_ZPchr0003g17796 [Zizania palustris]
MAPKDHGVAVVLSTASRIGEPMLSTTSIKDWGADVVDGVGGGHECRLDGAWAPVRVCFLDKGELPKVEPPLLSNHVEGVVIVNLSHGNPLNPASSLSLASGSAYVQVRFRRSGLVHKAKHPLLPSFPTLLYSTSTARIRNQGDCVWLLVLCSMAMVPADAGAKLPDVEKAAAYSSTNGGPTSAGTGGGGGGVVDSVVARWRREDLLDKSPLALHTAAAAFSFVALVLVASNQHGDWMEFDRYQEYRYLLAIAALAFAYSLAQALRHAYRMRRGADPVSAASGRLLDFAGDQVVAYLLMSALSAATPITNRMRSAVINSFTDTTAAAISMAFFAFVALALSAVISGYRLSKQTYM